MKYRFFIIVLSSIFIQCGKGTPATQNEIQKDSLTTVINEILKNWDPDKEPWKYVEFNIKDIDLTVKYGQQAAHPYLAEYYRTIEFSSKNHPPEVFEMTMNTGGKTFIKVYFDKANNIVVFKDDFGRYYYDLNKKEYSEQVWTKLEPYKFETVFIGNINGRDYSLVFDKEENK